MYRAEQILKKESLEKDDIIYLLSTEDKAERRLLFEKADRIRKDYVGSSVYLRGLIELSNICRKNCFYCGIRKDNTKVERYTLDERQVIDTVRQAIDHGFSSIVLQSGERTDKRFTSGITRLVRHIKEISGGRLGITLSCGEQDPETYREWFEAGAHRYLLSIDTSSEELYYKWHPEDRIHEYSNRVKSLEALKKAGYQVGTGVMIGAPYQNIETLAEDLLFIREYDVDMIGMGPYIRHEDTPV
jgi:biotin synthase